MGILAKVKNTLLGRPLRDSEAGHEKLDVFWGLPILASDAVSSVAYALEEILLVMVPALAAAAYTGTLFVVIPIFALLGILIYSYAQIIRCYPNGGGAYVVTQENFGRKTSLVAAATLVIAYVLTVSVSVSSATQAVASAFPELEPYRLVMCLAGVSILTLLNLRGVGESAKIFGVPTYLFILLMLVMIVIGFVRFASGDISVIDAAAHTEAPQTYADPAGAVGGAVGSLSLFLLLRAFSSGCSALTGVEAVSNAVPIFKAPEGRTAVRVLCALGLVILAVFGGTVALASVLHPIPMMEESVGYETVLSQIAHASFGGIPLGNLLYYALQGFTMLILLLAANTAYSGLPTLLAILARDSYIPRQFSHRGAKLSFSNGILFIWLAASALVLVFNADTHRMIPLYAAGVFVTFSLSQAGMFVRWLREKPKGWQFKAVVNAVGAVITLVGLVTVMVVRFKEAWLLPIAAVVFAYGMFRINKHYARIAQLITKEEFLEHYRKSKSLDTAPVIILMRGLTRPGLKLLNYANSITHNVRVLCVKEDEEDADTIQQKWIDWGIDVPLDVVTPPYRDILPPIREYLAEKEALLQPHEYLTVMMTKHVDRSWYSFFLHNQMSLIIQHELTGHRRIVTVLVPFVQ
ncbi:MAG: APC family permease [Oscillospiraceae bacterium]|jgi:amino acid transporter|nr:APC family permease [Oscillospiraceae bacterium]